MNRTGEHTFLLTSGREVKTWSGSFGLDEDLHPVGGWDMHIMDESERGDRGDWTPEERRELAEHEIARWRQFGGLDAAPSAIADARTIEAEAAEAAEAEDDDDSTPDYLRRMFLEHDAFEECERDEYVLVLRWRADADGQGINTELRRHGSTLQASFHQTLDLATAMEAAMTNFFETKK